MAFCIDGTHKIFLMIRNNTVHCAFGCTFHSLIEDGDKKAGKLIVNIERCWSIIHERASETEKRRIFSSKTNKWQFGLFGKLPSIVLTNTRFHIMSDMKDNETWLETYNMTFLLHNSWVRQVSGRSVAPRRPRGSAFPWDDQLAG